MQNNDFKQLKKLILGILWLVRANVTLLVVVFCFIVSFPVQLVVWLRNDLPIQLTEPYLFLRYLHKKGSAFPEERVLPYQEWKQREISKCEC